MASLVAVFITSACIGLSGPAKEACTHGLDAGAKQSGIEQSVNSAQKITTKNTKMKATKLVGQTPVDIVAGGFFIAKAVSDKAIGASVPTMGLADKIRAEVGKDKASFKMEWNFD